MMTRHPKGTASFGSSFQRTKATHQTELAMFLANASDHVLATISPETLDRRHGGKGGLARGTINCALLAELQRRTMRT